MHETRLYVNDPRVPASGQSCLSRPNPHKSLPPFCCHLDSQTFRANMASTGPPQSKQRIFLNTGFVTCTAELYK